MDLDTRRRMLFAGLGGFYLVGLLQVMLPGLPTLERAALQAAGLILVSLVVFRFLSRKS